MGSKMKSVEHDGSEDKDTEACAAGPERERERERERLLQYFHLIGKSPWNMEPSQWW